jgi:hypothetical protein
MRFLLAFVFSFISLFAIAQAPPMSLGGPQGINVTKSLVTGWLSIPNYVDTPVSNPGPLPWPGRGYVIQTIKNYRDATVEEFIQYMELGGFTQIDSVTWQDGGGAIYKFPEDLDSSKILDYVVAGDTSVWHYTGRQWKRVGGNAEFYFNNLIDGGFVSQDTPRTLRRFTISASEYYIRGVKYKYDTSTKVILAPKAVDSTGRIDVITLTPVGVKVSTGIPKRTPYKPRVGGDEIELTTIYFRPFDSIPNNIGSGENGIANIYRVPGKDSIFYTIDTLVFSIKDSIGISKNDTAAMLAPYATTAINGLSKTGTAIRLGGTLNQNTSIATSTNNLSFVNSTNDTTMRIQSTGNVLIGTTANGLPHRLHVIGDTKINNLEIRSGSNSSFTGQGIRIDGTDSEFALQGSGLPFTMFSFNQYGSTAAPISASSKSNVAINAGFSRPAGTTRSDTLAGNVLNIRPTYNISYDSGRSIVRGIYYNPTLTNINRTSHVAYENTTGTNVLNSVSGSTRIGYSLADTTYKLDVNGRVRLKDTLTLSTTPVTADTSANDLLVINSFNGQVRRFTGAWPTSYTASNGITLSGNNFKLGGTLTEFTTVNTTGTTLILGNPFGELIRIGSGNVLLRKLKGAGGVQDIELTSDSIYLRKIDGQEQTSYIDSRTTDTAKFKILTTNTTTGSLAVYTGAWPNNGLSGTATLDFGNTSAQNSADLTVTVTGAADGDVVSLGVPNGSVNANTCFTAWVSATNTVTVRFNNYSSGAVDPASGTFKIKVLK